jgi:hypothetical protein
MAPNLSHLGRPIPHRRRARKQGMVMTNKTQAEATITIGPRTRHEIELRIRELRARHNASPRDLREVARLEEFLRTVAPRDGRMAMIAVAAGSFALSLFLLCELPACAGSVVTPGDRGSVATPDDREPEHSFDGIYDQRQEERGSAEIEGSTPCKGDAHGLLLQRHAGGREERRHDGKIAVERSNLHWCSDGFEIACDNAEEVRVAFALDCCDREAIGHVAGRGE